MAGDEFDEQFTVGEADEVVEQVGALVDAGLDGLIFNMPLSDPDDRRPRRRAAHEELRVACAVVRASRSVSGTRPTPSC